MKDKRKVMNKMTYGEQNRHEKVLWELGHYGGNMSSDSYNYAMRRTAETFFPVWDKDKSFAMFDKCCDIHALGVEQRIIVRNCLKRHGFVE